MDAQTIETGNTTCITFQADNGYIVSGDGSGAIRRWRLEDGREVTMSAMKMNGKVYAVATSPDGRWVVTAASEDKVVVWSAVTDQKVIEVADHTGHVYAVDVSSDSRRFASGSHDKTVRIFDITSGRNVIPPLQHDGLVVGVKFSPDGSRIATAPQNHKPVVVYDAHSGNRLFEIPVSPFIWLSPATLAWSPSGQQLFFTSTGKITSVKLSTALRAEWSIHDTNTHQVSVVASGKFIACSAGSSVSFWDFTSREQIGRNISHSRMVTCIAISHDGRYLVCGCDTGVTVHSLEEYIPYHYLHGRGISRLPLMQVRETALESWKLGNLTETEAVLSDEIARCSDAHYEALAARALVRTHSGEWGAAIEDTDTSLRIKRSPIGQIARSIALVGAGKLRAALDNFDFVLLDVDSSDGVFLFVIKSILMFVCHERTQAVSRLRDLITVADEKLKDYCLPVLGNMYLKQGEYDSAVQTLKLVTNGSAFQEPGPLMTISIIFNWGFGTLEFTAWERLCETRYASGSIKEVGESLLEMVESLPEDAKQAAHGHVLEEIVTRSGEVTLLTWTGKSSTCNSCLPNSPAVYRQALFVLPTLREEDLEKRTAELREIIPRDNALFMYDRVIRLQPVRFRHFRLSLPCIVFRVKRLTKEQENVYRARTTTLGEVEFTTTDLLPLNEPRKLFLVNPWMHRLSEVRGGITWGDKDGQGSDVDSNTDVGCVAHLGDQLVRASIIEEVQTPPTSDTEVYTRALQLIARLEQPFSALLLMKHPDGTYRRVATDHDIVVDLRGKNVPKDIHVEVLEVL